MHPDMTARKRASSRCARALPMLALALLALAGGSAVAQSAGANLPLVIGQGAQGTSYSVPIQTLLFFTALSFLPAVLLLMTGFTRIVIVLSLTRSALGTQQIPPNTVLLGLALFLTFFTMAPTLNAVNDGAIKPYMQKKISFDQAVSSASKPVRAFMLKQAREKDLAVFVKLSKTPRPATPQDIPMSVLAPAFVVGELKTAFTIGFVIFIPFLVIDMVVSITLMSMGMMMLPPVMVSLPFKLLLFVLVDGWQLIAQSLSLSFH